MTMERISEASSSLWRILSNQSTRSSNDDPADAAERGELQTYHQNAAGEKTPLLQARDTARPTRTLLNRLSQVLSATLLAPVYSVLIFLPMLPFWIFAGFLVYLLGTSSNNNFYLYCGCLTVLLPFNIVGTTAIVRTVWMDLYGE